MAENEDRQAPIGREGAQPHSPAEVRPSADPTATPSLERARVAAARAKAKARLAAEPERHEPLMLNDRLVMSDELARELVGILELSDPDDITDVREGVAEARMMYLAEEPAAPQPPPAATERRLERLKRSLERSLEHGSPPNPKALSDLGVRRQLRAAGINFAAERYRAGKIEHKKREGSGVLAEKKIGQEEKVDEALYFVGRAIKQARNLKEPQRGRAGVRLGRHRQQTKTDAVDRLARLYRLTTGAPGTRGGRRGPSKYERFLEAALGDLTGSTGRALAKRGERYG